ncbi:hypothetical protein [Cohnella sp.]|uniref:hypothetical protein n=1 Tax=Cohnella sp. TaxID=1883426 RepID=UPI0035686162
MPRVLDTLRLHAESSLSERAMARSMSLPHGTVSNILARAKEAGLSWPLPANLDERKLESLLFPKAMGRPKNRKEPAWNLMCRESKK